MTDKLRALVLTGDGINCERETAHALLLAGFTPTITHLNDLIEERRSGEWLATNYELLALPGGFSFGDDLTSGKVLALKIEKKLGWDLPAFAARGGMVIGICNGFQALVRLGIFGKDVSITSNASGKFLNTWVGLEITASNSPWLAAAEFKNPAFDLPIRHGEGRIVTQNSDVLARIKKEGRVALRYQTDINGSEDRIAGLTDATGRILGLMPHPEAAVRQSQLPRWSGSNLDEPAIGLLFFQNAATHLKEKRT